MKFLKTVYGLPAYYKSVREYNLAGIAWNAVNRSDGGWDFYCYDKSGVEGESPLSSRGKPQSRLPLPKK